MIQRKETLDDVLSVIESLYEEGRYERAQSELSRSRSLHPNNLTLLEWEAVFALEDGRPRDALYHLDRVLEAEPNRRFAQREKASVLQELGRFEDSLEILEQAGPEADRDAAYYYNLGSCLDRVGGFEQACGHLERAARLDPEDFARPLNLEPAEFDRLVERAVAGMPETLRPYLRTVAIAVDDYPPRLDPDPFVLGLYNAAPRLAAASDAGKIKDEIILYKRNLEMEFPDAEALEEEIRKTIIHEIAHQHALEEEF